MEYKRIFNGILLIIAILIVVLVSCTRIISSDYSGKYTGSHTSIILQRDSVAVIKKRLHLSGFTTYGYWHDHGQYIVIDIPKDTISYTAQDIARLFAKGDDACSIILEKKGNTSLLWRNEDKLRKHE